MPDPLSGFTYPSPYPYPTGYAALDDVRARINAGTWDPDKPTAAPTAEQVQQWLLEATAHIDVALRTRGYYVPLTAIAGWAAPTGMPTYQGIGLGAWWLLKNLAATYAAHWVELSRHGSHGQHHDPNAAHLMELFDDFSTRLESGADNLAAYGVGGDFPPEIDVSRGVMSGSIGATLSDPNVAEGPVFTKNMRLGSGYELLTPPAAGDFTGI